MEFVIPNLYPKQKEFCKSKAKYICYGGARGGGKSFVLRVKAILLALNYPGIQILLLRRTYGELLENHIIPLQKMLHSYEKDVKVNIKLIKKFKIELIEKFNIIFLEINNKIFVDF